MKKSPNHKGHALRHSRFSEPGRIYLITTVTHERTMLFTDFQLGRLLVSTLRNARAQTLCYVVMPDHLHWLLQLEKEDLSSVMQGVKSVSAHSINRSRGTHRPVWQAGFHDHALRRDEDVKSVARYVVANPKRAGLVQRLGDYPLWDAMWL
ncbi:MAG: transposase [Gammaproteobacteria bacterium (ex Lamellibrachia satsuma)]|nr:MAG: transposase [Gammaproteobacteria bacterium (ex Lamellibrachia satsuma)]RRS33468.1 MAG: transposase [Gammaproteobacteria bacterium (ex Lamellibrachia satsuma)]RRS37645.1 MAG: transposase [Gammaproteobacteria bacterium (ex Lamellibrachia satsuma)]